MVESRGWARFAAYSCEPGVLAWRSGFLTREWVIARIDKGQGLALRTSPFDRRAGMASVELDTAGSSAIGSHLRVPYLDEPQARMLMARLRSGIDIGADPAGDVRA
ncbi:MAG: PH domain-containing protein [Rhodanobacteraceae bacterium]|nr:PH domain-containing protein [Rhodanobacteraceae bacterium]